jgi:Dolichyl-phosphate-mannose-protein mannosyltransferase
MATLTAPHVESVSNFCGTPSPARAQLSSGSRVGPHIWLLAFILCLVTIFLAYRIYRAGELGQLTEDEAHHAVTGLYFADLITDLPIAHPIDYTYRYYARYPALGVMHWPPFFHICEGVVFLIGGRSPATARFTVLMFTLLGLSYWFLLVRELLDPWAAAFSGLALAFLPFVATYEQAVMLEIPSLALCIAATYYWAHFLQSHTRAAAVGFVTFAALALLTKQQSVYLLPFCGLTLLSDRRSSSLLNRKGFTFAMLFLLFVAVSYLLLLGPDLATIKQEVIPGHAYRFSYLLFGVGLLPAQLGWPMVILSAIGVVTCYWWSSPRNSRLMLLWILACYLTFSFLNSREDRYFLNWIPPLIYFASWPLAIAPSRAGWRVGATLLVGGALVCSWVGNAQHYPYVSGYAPMARQVVQGGTNGEIILFDGNGKGNFIFNMRVLDPHRNFVVLTKGMYATRIIKQLGAVEIVHDTEGLQRLIAAYGIRHIVVTDQTDFMFPIQRTLRDFLKSPRFRLVATIPVVTDSRNPLVHNLRLYENQEVSRPEATSLRLTMLTLSHDIDVPLRELGIY